jgi:hypothetical protein
MLPGKDIPLMEDTCTIEPQRSLLDLRLSELWRYKDLVMLFVRREFVSVYKLSGMSKGRSTNTSQVIIGNIG